MGTTLRAVGALKLNASPDPRVRPPSFGGHYDRIKPEDLLVAAKIQESVVIPMEWTRTSDTLFIQYWYSAEGVPSSLLNVIFRANDGQLSRLAVSPISVRLLFPTIAFGNTLGATPPSLSKDQWFIFTAYVGPAVVMAHSGAGQALRLDQDMSCDRFPKTEALIVLADKALMIAEIRLWEGRPYAELETLVRLMEARLDGRERGLIGYWKFDEGQGARVEDSARYGKTGALTGGQWISADSSGLTLDCTLEEVEALRAAVIKKQNECHNIATEIGGLNQERELLAAQLQALNDLQNSLEKRAQEENKKLAEQMSNLEKTFIDWQEDIKQGGRVSLDTFSKTVAEEVDQASRQLDEANSPYTLQGIDLEVKLLPTQTAEEEDFRLVFPPIHDPNVQAEQLSTLSLRFATRPKAPTRAEESVPNVRGYTELAARRKLGEVGFRVEVMDHVAEREEDVGRVFLQTPPPDTETVLDSIVTIFVGRSQARSFSASAVADKA